MVSLRRRVRVNPPVHSFGLGLPPEVDKNAAGAEAASPAVPKRGQMRDHGLLLFRRDAQQPTASSFNKDQSFLGLGIGSTVTGSRDMGNGQAGVGGKVPTCERRQALYEVLGSERLGGDD